MEDLTTEVIATPTDSSEYIDNNYSFDDMYLLHFVFILFAIALLSKNLFRKMYINILGGRKGE